MIVLDTNVVSELTRPNRSIAVLDWMKAQVFEDLFTTAITEAEILERLSRLPPGKRLEALRLEANAVFDHDFEDRILVFDSRIAIRTLDQSLRRTDRGYRIRERRELSDPERS